MTEKSPVRKYAGAKSDVADGGYLEIECLEDIHKDQQVWRGRWRTTVVTTVEGGVEHRALLVTAGDASIKIIVTVTGLISMAVELGYVGAEIPFREGDSVVWDKRL